MGVPSGPYLVLPVFGPSTFRDGFGLVVDGYARPQRYILEDEEGLYWAEQALRGIDVRSQLIDIEGAIQGDKYSSIRDIYLQRKNFIIAEKKAKKLKECLLMRSVMMILLALHQPMNRIKC